MRLEDAVTQRHTEPDIGAASRLVPVRHDVPELLDLGVGSPQDVQKSLDDLWRINRYLWGTTALTRHLFPRLAALEQTGVCVDLGAGAAQVSGAIAGWAGRRKLDVRVIALDFSARNLVVAESHSTTNGVKLVQADAMRLPFAPGSVDYFISSLFLHHFVPEAVVDLLGSAYAIARRGIIMSDLVRGWLPLAAFKLVQPVFARSYLTRHDGAVSIRRAYTPAELSAMARAAGIPNVRVHTHWPWRMTLAADK
jgi:2-polyprenyl-3-methyl-5-hydroxy-6-metoxy-1,4-benzoquinol methylase